MPTHTALQKKWYKHIQAWKQSNLSQKAYCDQHNLKSSQLSYWYRKFEQAKVPQAATLAPSNFVPVTMSEESKIKDNNHLSPDLTLQLPNGACLTGIQLSNIEVVQALLKGL